MGPAEFWVLESPAAEDAGNTNRKLSLVKNDHLDQLMVISYRCEDRVIVVIVAVTRVVLLWEGGLQEVKEQTGFQLMQKILHPENLLGFKMN